METLDRYFDFNIYALCFMVIGFIIRYVIGRRRFNRRGIGGLQHFSSYGIGLITTIAEWLFKWIANLLIVIGIFLSVNW